MAEVATPPPAPTGAVGASTVTGLLPGEVQASGADQVLRLRTQKSQHDVIHCVIYSLPLLCF